MNEDQNKPQQVRVCGELNRVNEQQIINPESALQEKEDKERLRELNIFIKNFWEREVLGNSIGLSDEEFLAFDNQQKLEIMHSAFLREIEKLVEVLGLPVLDKEQFENLSSTEFLNFLDQIANIFPEKFPVEAITTLKQQINSLDDKTAKDKKKFKQIIYLDIMNRCVSMLKSSNFLELPSKAKKFKTGNCFVISLLLVIIGKKAGLNCEIASEPGHIVTILKTENGEKMLFNFNRPNEILTLSEGKSIEGFSTYVFDSTEREYDHSDFQMYIPFTHPEFFVETVLTNVRFYLDPKNFEKDLSSSKYPNEDISYRNYLITTYPDLENKLAEAINYLCPKVASKIGNLYKTIENLKKKREHKIRLEKVLEKFPQNWENVFAGREERAKDKSRQNHPDFVRYQEWLIDQVKDKLSSYQRRDGKTYYDLTLLFCPPPFLEKLLSLLGDSITHVNIVDFSKTVIESIREVLEKLRSEPNRRLGNSLISIPDDIKELFSDFYDDEYEIGKGNTIILSVDFFSPDLWKEMIQIFLEKEEAKTLIFEVLENSETEDWKSYLHPQGYRYFVYSKEYVETMFSQLGVQNFQITPSRMITSPTGYSFRTLLITIKKE